MRNLLSARPRSIARRTRAAHARRMHLESLEGRELLTGISFPDFSNAGGLSLLGSASTTADNRLRLTPAIGGQSGAAWYTAEKQFAGAAFETTFQFRLDENFDSPGGSDGFVFLIQNTSPTYLSGGGGTLGYDGLTNSLAVEFDTFQNSEVTDPSPSHISVHTNGTGANGWSETLSIGSYNTAPVLLDDAAVHTAKIAYTPGSMSIYLDDLTTPKLTVAVDLAESLALDAGKAWVGFTAATGGGYQNHDILNWSYTVLPDVSTTVTVNDVAALEGNGGTSASVFTVTRAGNTTGTTTVNWSTANRTATAGSDYTAASGQVVFGPGDTQQTITVLNSGDTAIEPNETFVVRLAGATGGAIADGVGIGTILTDDVTISVSDATAVEGSRALTLLGRFVSDSSGGLARPRGSIFGPDGNGDGAQDLYVASADTDQVLRYDGLTGSFLGAFVSSGSGGLDSPLDLGFGPDGRLYVTSFGSGELLRYDGSTGAFVDRIASGLSQPQGLSFGTDGSVYIANQGTDEILRFDGTGLSVFVGAGSGGLDQPRHAIFGPDGNLYVASQATQQVLRYQGQTGAFMNEFATTDVASLGSGPIWIEFGADGYLYATARSTPENLGTSIVRFDAATGAFVDTFALGRDGWSFILGPDGLIYNSGNGAGAFVDRIGASSLAAFTVSLSSTSAAPVTVSYAIANGTAVAGSDFVSASGTLTFAPGETTKTILVRTVDDSVGEPAETFTVNLSSPTGAAIADGQAVGTIRDDDTKFFVVDDAATNRTYEYDAAGGSAENYILNAANTAPRGAASTIAGDKVWVVDANKTVYVYDTGGALLGSWAAGNLVGVAVVEGIATDGSDVWIVDAKQDRVYRYPAAASRTSGSQNASSSFSLNSGNRDPKDVVTDGVNLWVINNSTTDKVFKYTIAGALVGSWTIAGAGASPTGITLDPTGGGALWIVDNGTDLVYQFDNARGLTSGSLSPSTSFALAAGNANPQGIADPPAAGATIADPPRVATTAAPRPTGRSFTASRPLFLTPIAADADRAPFDAVPAPSGPRALRSRLTSHRRRA